MVSKVCCQFWGYNFSRSQRAKRALVDDNSRTTFRYWRMHDAIARLSSAFRYGMVYAAVSLVNFAKVRTGAVTI